MMKKLLLISFLFFCAAVKAQNPIPNPSFENWTDHGNYSDPTSWQSDNFATATILVTVTQDTLPVEGESNVLLTTKGDVTTVPGVLCAGTFNDTKLRCENGFPVTKSYNYFNGYAWYKPLGNDIGIAAAYLFKYNTVTEKRDTLAIAFSELGNTNGVYQPFSIPFLTMQSGVADTALIVFSSSNNIVGNPPSGTKLRIDNIELSDFTGIGQVESMPVNLFPNPADDRIIFQMPPTVERYTLNIYDIMGGRLRNIFLQTNHYQVSTANFPPGIFFYDVRNEAGKVSASGSFEVQH